MTPYRRRLGPGPTAPDDEVASEVEEEIEAHLELRTQELVARGTPPGEARAEALRRFGDGRGARRRLLAAARRRRRRRLARIAGEAMATDVRLSVRRARRAPAFTSTALLIFAAGVGLTTSMFTVADNVLFRPLPFPEPDELIALWSVPERGEAFRWVSMGNWVDWRSGATSLESTALWRPRRASVGTEDGAFFVPVTWVTGGFFETLGTSFTSGGPFTEEEAQSQEALAVVGEGFWRRVLGAEPDLARAELVVDGRHVTVVGVVSSEQAFPAGTDIWLPLRYRPETGPLRNNINYEAIARLRDGATAEHARRELDAVATGIRASDPEAAYSWGVGVRPLRDSVVGDARRSLVMLTAAVGLLLLVTSANLAGLSLARARQRANEAAVHLALGARRLRLAGRVVTEHVLLALAGGGAGILLAWLGTGALMGRVAAVVPRANEVGFDARVAALGIVASLVAGVMAGLVPALFARKDDLAAALSGVRGHIQGGRGLPGAVMVGTEIALAVSLLVAGSLLLRSFVTVVSRDLGYEPERLFTAELTLVGSEYADDADRLAFWDAVTDRLRGHPGVAGVALSNWVPTSDGGRGWIDLPGREGDDIGAGYRVISERYFDVLETPVLRGHGFDTSDGVGTERVAIVSHTMADAFWPGENPLGRRVRARSMERYVFGNEVAPWLTVVGVVGDMRQYGFESDLEDEEMYVLHRQVPYYTRGMALVVRGRPGLAGVDAAIRAAVAEIDPAVPVEIASMEQRLAALTEERRLILAGVGLFAGASLALVCLGIYGLMSFAAGERRREIAIRVALGAGRTGVVQLLLGSALKVVVAGAAAGLVAGFGFSGLLESLLVEVTPTDPASYAAAVGLLALVAIAAAGAPTLRAAREDPLVALRREG